MSALSLTKRIKSQPETSIQADHTNDRASTDRKHTTEQPQLNPRTSHISRRSDTPKHKTYNSYCLGSTCSCTTTHSATILRQHTHNITSLDSHRNRTTQLCHQLIMRPQSHLVPTGSEDMMK